MVVILSVSEETVNIFRPVFELTSSLLGRHWWSSSAGKSGIATISMKLVVVVVDCGRGDRPQGGGGG